MHLFDAHCHLQDEKLAPRLDEAMKSARAAGIGHWVCCGSAENDWEAVRALAQKYPGVIPSFGLHPWYVRERSQAWLARLREFLHSIPSAIGEIGLDHAIEPRNDEEQESVFVEQVQLAREMNRPFSVHCRRAWGRLVPLLTEHAPYAAGFLIHSYSGGPDLVSELAKLGAFFSFSGSITFSGNKKGHRSVRAVPDNRLLIETDAPDIPPYIPDQPDSRGELNVPANLVHVLNKIAELRSWTAEKTAEITRENGMELFKGLPPIPAT